MNTSVFVPPVMARPIQAMASEPLFGHRKQGVTQKAIQDAFSAQDLNVTQAKAKAIQAKVKQAVELIKQYPNGNSQIDTLAVNIGAQLGMNMMQDASVKTRIQNALKAIAAQVEQTPVTRPEEPVILPAWKEYFDKTVNLTGDRKFLDMTREKGFSPVKISWEDIGRYQGSSWGNRISDVGIWVRKNEGDPQSAQLALSVRRDNNFRDTVLMVPAEKIKIHTKDRAGQTQEVSLPKRLQELGLTSKEHDANVIVSNQFAVVPVPAKDMKGSWKEGKPPRAAFNFSIAPYGSKNVVITDVIEGSSTAVVSGRGHQLLYANVDGQKAPFTASRAADRQDLMKLEKDLKAKGMDVDVQRYYLIQVPLKNEASVTPSNMGEPPFNRGGWLGGGLESYGAIKSFSFDSVMPPSLGATRSMKSAAPAGLDKVAIGTGETEGTYNEGDGFRGQRAEEPIRVTVCYFVTPKGEITETDMKNFTKAFEQWDGKAIWGGSFVVPEKPNTIK